MTAPITSAAPPTIINATALRFDDRRCISGGAPRRDEVMVWAATRALAVLGPRTAALANELADVSAIPATAVSESTSDVGTTPTEPNGNDPPRKSTFSADCAASGAVAQMSAANAAK